MTSTHALLPILPFDEVLPVIMPRMLSGLSVRLFGAAVLLLPAPLWAQAEPAEQAQGDAASPSADSPPDQAQPAQPAEADSPAAPAAAEPGLPAGHSMHGEVFNEGPRQKAYLMPGTGGVHLEITTSKPEAQQFFDQGLGQLHGFWFFEAERSFRQAAALDPQCAMAYWGMAMANRNNEKRAQGFIEKARALRDKASRREQMWIDALDHYLTGKKDNKQRRTDFIRALEDIIHEFPAELEAKALLAWFLWDSHGTLPIASHEAVDALIGEVLRAEPLHPAHHYRIHLWDNRKPARAVESAALCGPAAPGIAHMWHMPGHTYWKLARYVDSAWQQEASARVDHAHMMRDRVMPYEIHNYAHNNEWLVRSLSHVGRARDAVALAKNLIELPRHPQKNSPKKGGSAAAYGRTRLLEVLQRYELWEELIELADTMYLEPSGSEDDDAKRLRVLGAAHLSLGNLECGKEQLARLQALHEKLRGEQSQAGDEAEAKARQENKPDDQVTKARQDAQKRFEGRLKQLEQAMAELEALAALAAGDQELAREHLARVTDLSKERQARLYLLAGDAEKAEQLARQAAESGKNQVLPAAIYVDILWQSGKTKEAGEAFAKLRGLASQLDLDLPILRRLEAVARELGLGTDWREPYVPAGDLGERPSLDALGPFRWQPVAAAPWSLPDAEGKPRSLGDYQGRPVVVIFYLGYGCLHCVEQLKKFAPRAGEFEEAGISLVAISTDSVGDLRRSVEAFGADFPFPLVSDANKEVFRAYRAYDDFEEQPLHGTFLIDGRGLMRWQDVSFEPFTDAEFLLNEAKRLLGEDE